MPVAELPISNPGQKKKKRKKKSMFTGEIRYQYFAKFPRQLKSITKLENLNKFKRNVKIIHGKNETSRFTFKQSAVPSDLILQPHYIGCAVYNIRIIIKMEMQFYCRLNLQVQPLEKAQ